MVMQIATGEREEDGREDRDENARSQKEPSPPASGGKRKKG
jgi:hypothetical protein